jgi:Ca-activated chloride channel homolog
MCSKQAVSCQFFFLILIFLLTFVFAAREALAQTSIDDVHITSRERPQVAAIAAFPPGIAAFAGKGLIHTQTELVMVPVTITDEMNRPVIGLDQGNFQVFENKKAQEIKNFSSEDSPISVGFIVDTSGSMSYKLERARDAVIQFCETANPQDEFFMITFADQPVLASDFTNRTEEIENDLLAVRSHGRTSLLDAIYMGVRRMRDARYARKALVILSDGGDNHSRYTEHDVMSAIKESDLLIYSVGIYERYFATQEEMLGPELLRSVSSLTGGQSFTLSDVNDMPAVTKTIGTQLRHQYMLAYEPQSKANDGKWHKISVKLLLPKKLHNYFFHIDARTGYYASEE